MLKKGNGCSCRFIFDVSTAEKFTHKARNVLYSIIKQQLNLDIVK